ncbi:GAF and HD-GYP domain-containing protein [Methylogaea oryzae]|uniref:HD family phosphohydrolase n=1 Tax=Methylogaea oryzae TaxID=1295382 RepID=A0A8D5AJB8_9GAMM|nr:HD family phosphohydrolase [Methylogaea oryzae]BBL72251.1 HD family phosphohydrolase [Methylogaea oryzae]
MIERLEQLIDIGIALSAETDPVRLQERILDSARALTHADGGTLYSVSRDAVSIVILRNASLNMSMGGSGAPPCTLPPIPLYKEDGSPNLNNVVTCAVHTNATVNIADSYDTESFDFSGTRRFDTQTGYRSTSFLTVPLRNHENEIIGVLQLINATPPDTGVVAPFDSYTQRLVEALASQAAVALTKEQLIGEMKQLFEALIHLVADAIDRKSPYTGGHCRRVPAITMALAEAAHSESDGPLKDFHLDDQDRYELEIAGWLHDCGKITTPEYVVDKATKLETICDRIHLVDSRFEILMRDKEIECLKRQLEQLGVKELSPELQQELQASHAELNEQRQFLRRSNTGSEFMNEQDQERVRIIGQQTWLCDGQTAPLLSENEIHNLTISRGTLTPEERKIINDHIRATIDMLNNLPFPKHLRRVPEYAAGHHERMDGKGYPNGLTREEMSVQARILGIADIFEALTACDRPYKSAKKLSEALKIMAFMKKEGHIDPDLFEVFLRRKVYLQYAEQYLSAEQIDEVNVEQLLLIS